MVLSIVFYAVERLCRASTIDAEARAGYKLRAARFARRFKFVLALAAADAVAAQILSRALESLAQVVRFSWRLAF